MACWTWGVFFSPKLLNKVSSLVAEGTKALRSEELKKIRSIPKTAAPLVARERLRSSGTEA